MLPASLMLTAYSFASTALWVDCNSEPSWYLFDALSQCTLQVRMLETCRGFHHKRAGEFELILPVTSTGQIGQCLKCSCLWVTSPPARRLFERLSASNLRPVYPGTPWYDCTLLIFVACTWLVPPYIPMSLSLFVYYTTWYILYTWYMIGTTIHSYLHSYIHFILCLFVLCLSDFIVAQSLDDDSCCPGAWWLWPKALGHDAGTTTAAAVGGDRLRFSHHKSQQIAYWKIGGPGCTWIDSYRFQEMQY